MKTEPNPLQEVLEEGILGIDTYIQVLGKFINKLEERGTQDDSKREMQDLKMQYRSLLFSLSIIKEIKRKKLDLLKKISHEENNCAILSKFINLKLHLRHKEGPDRILNLRLILKDYNYWKSNSNIIYFKIHLNNYPKKGSKEIINLKLRLT